jgi:hypothetical protein
LRETVTIERCKNENRMWSLPRGDGNAGGLPN